ncbi:uncharacterized protein VTP21DRAFT_10123 [Calcarisporiella thermophila]|uniref:uncharacterized protein n=1 Tax=Calcarisporiella thermophila TaxID=911321 RepID=UPI003742628E
MSIGMMLKEENSVGYPSFSTVHLSPDTSPPQSSISAGEYAAATEMLKKRMINDKVRAENRERKARWRKLNEERNKDNDLRCRVNKRAVKLFGKEESEHKQRWVEEEFNKRRAKRVEKERRRQAIRDAYTPDKRSSISSASSDAAVVMTPTGTGSISPSQPTMTAAHALHLSDISAAVKIESLDGIKTEIDQKEGINDKKEERPTDLDAVLTLMQLNGSAWCQ